MKLRDIIANVQKTKETEQYICIDELAQEQFNLSVYNIDQQRLKAYFFFTWLCTDSWVGFRAYFLDNDPVAVSYQSCRKGSEDFEWISKEAYTKTRDFLLSLVEVQEEEDFRLVDLDEDYSDGNYINYFGQYLSNFHKNPTFEGKPVVILGKTKDKKEDPWSVDNFVTIKFEDGQELPIEISKIKFPYLVKQEGETV
jgi:hypothetical protein